jgi:hypothetical protein
LKKVELNTEVRTPLRERVWTRLLPVCSSALVAPVLSLLPPVKF